MKTKTVKKIIRSSAAFCLAFSLPAFSASAADYVPLAPITGTVLPTGGTDLPTYLTGIFKVGVAAAGALAFLTIVWGGFTYLSTDAITGKEEGKAKITRALGGLVLALAAFIILNTINPQLVNLNLNFGGKAKPGTALNAPPADLIPSGNDQAVADLADLATLTAETRGNISQKLNDRIQALDAISRTRALTPAEQQEWNDLNVVRDGTVAINKIDAAQVSIFSNLGQTGFLYTLNKNAQTAIDQMRSEADTRIQTMAADGATVGQMAVVRNKLNKTVQQINDCITYLNNGNRGKFATYCK